MLCGYAFGEGTQGRPFSCMVLHHIASWPPVLTAAELDTVELDAEHPACASSLLPYAH
jgi:hypothetical protein